MTTSALAAAQAVVAASSAAELPIQASDPPPLSGIDEPAEQAIALPRVPLLVVTSWLLGSANSMDQSCHTTCRLFIRCWRHAAESDLLRRVLRKVQRG